MQYDHCISVCLAFYHLLSGVTFPILVICHLLVQAIALFPVTKLPPLSVSPCAQTIRQLHGGSKFLLFPNPSSRTKTQYSRFCLIHNRRSCAWQHPRQLVRSIECLGVHLDKLRRNFVAFIAEM